MWGLWLGSLGRRVRRALWVCRGIWGRGWRVVCRVLGLVVVVVVVSKLVEVEVVSC